MIPNRKSGRIHLHRLLLFSFVHKHLLIIMCDRIRMSLIGLDVRWVQTVINTLGVLLHRPHVIGLNIFHTVESSGSQLTGIGLLWIAVLL